MQQQLRCALTLSHQAGKTATGLPPVAVWIDWCINHRMACWVHFVPHACSNPAQLWLPLSPHRSVCWIWTTACPCRCARFSCPAGCRGIHVQLPCPSCDNLHSVVACPAAGFTPQYPHPLLTHISVASMAILPPQVRDQALGQAQESLPESDAGKEYALHRMQVRRGHSTRSRTSCGAGGAVAMCTSPVLSRAVHCWGCLLS